MNPIRAFAISLLITLPGISTAYDNRPADIAERIKAVGSVCIEGQPCASQTTSSATTPVDTPAPETIYSTYCAVCHQAGVAGAPIVGDNSAWSARLDDGIESIYANAINGIGGMPAKGLCTTCADTDITATIDYMMQESGIQ